MDTLPILLKNSKKPSEFIKTREEKSYSVTVSSERKVPIVTGLERETLPNCTISLDRPLFQPEPSNLTLEGFEPFKTYELAISFRNIDKVPRKIRLEQSNNSYFTVQGWKKMGLQSEKIAPGMEIQYIVKFTPEERVDYVHELVCVTEREKFIVPIKAVGARGILDFPDQIGFSDAPVRFESKKIILVRNIGDADAKFRMKVDAPFSISPAEGFLKKRENMQFNLSFLPKQTGSFISHLIVEYDSGDSMHVELFGNAENMNIRLDKSHIRMSNTMNLTASKVVKLINRSDLMVKYQWKKCSNELEEAHLCARKNLDLVKEEQDEIMAIENSGNSSLSKSLVRRKYMNKKLETQAMDMSYSNPIFKITPSQGTLWPGSSVDVTVYFHPKTAGDHSSIAYCEVEGRESRLPLQLKGASIGPKVKFSYTSFSIGEIFIGTSHIYELLLENVGGIKSKFSLIQNQTLFGPKFKFNPSQGVIHVGEQLVIEVIFQPDNIIGSFNEEIFWELEGGADKLQLSFSGAVVPPTFEFDTDLLLLPDSSFGFSVQKEFKLTNTCQIPMSFDLVVLNDHGDVVPDFVVSPSRGKIPPMDSVPLVVEFWPKRIDSYNADIVVNVESVGENLLRLPIQAKSVVPEISLKKSHIEMKDCFLDFSYTDNIELVNDTEFTATYVIPTKENGKNSGYYYYFEYAEGVIAPYSSVFIPFTIRLKRLGSVTVPIFVNIVGSSSPPLACEVSASAVGSTVQLSANEINFGKIPVLDPVTQSLLVENTSPITAFFTCYTPGDSGIFTINPSAGEILPGESVYIEVTALLNDTTKFNEVMKIAIASGDTLEVPILAKGFGSTIVYDEGLKIINFNDVFSNQECSASFIMYNKGRRTQHIAWSHATTKDPILLQTQIFEVIPQRYTLKPKSHQVLFIKGRSNVAAYISDKLLCYTNTEKDPTRRLLLESLVSVNFINPLVAVTPDSLYFNSVHTTDDSFRILERKLNLRNSNTLALTMSLKCPLPFRISEMDSNILLEPNSEKTVTVFFDPSHNYKRLSVKETGKLTFTYQEHPQKDSISLISEVFFPNLVFEKPLLEFGCIQNQAHYVQTFNISNTSTLPVTYQWYFCETDEIMDSKISQAFDIIPLHGKIEPGKSQEVAVYFYGHPDESFQTKAICDVSGGPKYELPIHGKASAVLFSIERTEINYESISYQSIVDQDFVIENNGLVSFDFKVILDQKSNLFEKMVIIPPSGTIAPRTKQRLLIRFSPCVPEDVKDSFFIRIGDFEPVKIGIVAKGVFPRLSLDLPRLQNVKHEEELSKILPTSDVDYESDRIILKNQTLSYLKTLREITPHTADAKFIGSSLLFQKGFQPKKPKNIKEPKLISLQECSVVEIGTYVFDLGTVIRHSTIKKTFTIKNGGSLPVSFTLQKPIGHSSGFSIEPEKVKSLPPGESLDFTVVFIAKSEAEKSEINVPFFIAGGPTMNLKLVARLAIPEFKINDGAPIDFGELLNGFRKSMVLQIQNCSAVGCDWAYSPADLDVPGKKKKGSSAGLRDFEVVPSAGFLEPLAKSTVIVRFQPRESRNYDMTLPFKINMNPKNIYLHAYGIGTLPEIIFDPPSLSMGPILPYSDGAECKVTITNNSNMPVELFCTNFDQQFKQDEDILKQLDLNENSVIFLPPRDLETSFADYLSEFMKKKISDKKEVSDLKNSAGSHIGSRVGDLNKTFLSGESISATDGHFSVLIHGPPLSGRTTQAKKIANFYLKTYINLDMIIEKSSLYLEKFPDRSTTESIEKKIDEETIDNRDYKAIFSDESICDMIKLHFQDNHGKGYVIDSLETKYSSNIQMILKQICKSLLDKPKRLYVFHLTFEFSKIRDREMLLQSIQTEKKLAQLRVKEISEEEYDKLSQTEKDNYDQAMLRYKRKVKEIEEKRKERRHFEEDSNLKSGDKKNSDDKSKRRGQNLKGGPLMETKVGGPLKEKGTKKTDINRKALNEKGEKHDKDKDRESPEEILTEDTFVNESTFRRVELYCNTLDSAFSLFREGKDGEKGASKSAPQNTANDKKNKLAKQQTELTVAPFEPESHPTEETLIPEFHEFSVNQLDEDGVFKCFSDVIPAVSKDEIAKGVSHHTVESWVDQVFTIRQSKQKLQQQKIFSILSGFSMTEQESEAVDSTLSGVPTISAPAPKAADQSKDSKRAYKAGAKVVDEKTVDQEDDAEKDLSGTHRWIFQRGEKKDIVIRYNPLEAVKAESTLHFEIVGWQQEFLLPLVGLCQYSQISTDCKKIFEKCRKNKEEKELIHGEFILGTNTFDFGPLLQNKPRDKLDRFPENRTILNISNPGKTEIKVFFGLKNDTKQETFFIEPPNISILPGKSSSVTLWAYPKTSSQFEDLVVVSIKDNPEPFMFKVACVGVKPELESDRKTLTFDKLLVGRSDRRDLRIKNPTTMPVYWRFAGLDLLGEEFNINPTEGQIDSFQEIVVTADFRGSKAFVTKRVLKLEVSDPEKISGIVQEIPIVVTAEAYDIAMDIHFPKGFEGGIDFGTIKVSEEGKQLVTLKNKGKYEIGFKFLFDSPHFSELITITPQQGIIQPSEKPYFVQFIFKSPTEMNFKDFLVLKCIVFEPATGEITASIPVKVSGRAVFSKFVILPARDLNFGALVHGSKSTKQFVIENSGEFDFKFSIAKILLNETKQGVKGKGRPFSPPPAPKIRKDATKQGDTMTFGAFTVFPTNGIIFSGTKQVVTVDFHADAPGAFEETVGIDISDRSPLSGTDPIEYNIIGESCIPGINTTDYSSIFEEQSVLKRLELFKTQSNVYAEEDRAFFFGAFLAGQQVQVHFKITNPFKVGCEVVCCTKARGKTKAEGGPDLAFDLEPKKLTIPSHEHRYVTVFFHPTSIQTYSGIFEAMVENVQESKNKLLSFELRGEGTLPRISVEKPVAKSKSGAPILKFRRLMVGSSQVLPILLKNDGIIPANMKLEWAFKDNDDFFCSFLNDYQSLKPGETRSIDIKCQPSAIRKLEGELRLKVLDNSFEDSSIFISGEGYLDDLTIEVFSDETENELYFNDCYVGETRNQTFKIKNHSADWIRCSFADNPDFLFSPSICHIRPHGSRDITVSFSPKSPADIQKVVCAIKASKIRFSSGHPTDTEWDDRMKIVKWNNQDHQTSKGKKVIESISEPLNEILSNLNDFQIVLNGFADYSIFESDCSRIHFKSTLMFQNRVFRFPLKNLGKVSIKFSCEIFQDEAFSMECEDSPFSVTPSSGKILPGELIMITVRFSPQEVGEYFNFIAFKMANLSKDLKPLVIQVDGYSLRPFCHFELDDIDPLSIESRTPERSLANGVPIVLEPNTKIIEFKSCGIKVRNTTRFYIVNPTQNSYDFIWKHESVNDSKSFKCLTPRGSVASGKKSEIVFEFNPETLDTKESLWSFNLPEHEVRIPFLMIGYASEPNVYISQSGVNFRSVLVGRHAKEMFQLVNDEMSPFAFNFNDAPETGNEGLPVLRFNPVSGVVPPQSELPIEILFAPPSEKFFNFNLVCNVKKKPTPISVNIKGEGYKIHDSVSVEMLDGSHYELGSDPDSQNEVDFGVVQLNDKRIKRIIINNSGKYNFDFSWKITKKGKPITISPEIGTVLKGEKVFCELIFSPSSPVTIKDFKMQCQILNGRTIPLSISAVGTRPLVKFNYQLIEFGTQFVLKSGMNPVVRNLEITNNDISEMSLELVSLENSWMDIPRGIYTFYPSETKIIPVAFLPRDSIKYQGTIKYEVNGLSAVEIPVSGEGSEYRLETDFQTVNFGALRIGQSSSKSIKITNKSKISAQLSLGPSSLISSLSSLGITISNWHDTILRPKGGITLEIRFQPHKRISPFSEEVSLEFFGQSKPLFLISGACQGIEIKLENDTLPFGAVVQRSLTTRKVQLQNIGDIGAKFSWDSSKLQPNFSITPLEGYISPGMDIPLEITFHPPELNPDIRAENVICKIEGAPALNLTLSGMCVPQPSQADVFKFATPVRTSETKSIVLNNRSNYFWRISPIIENDSWIGPEIIEVDPGQAKSYDITFSPCDSVGTGEGGRHEGTIFFPLPDGNGILYRLQGNVDKPLPSGNINREIPCKTVFTEVLQVSNWLRRPQKFRVVTEFAKTDGSVVFKGHDFVDLSPLMTKDYKFTFYAYKEGIIPFKVIFKNEYTQEYLYYNLTYKSTPPGIISTIDITAPIRMLQTRDVTISNPLSNPVTFSCSSNNPEVTLPHTFTVPAKSDGIFVIEFLPLQPKESMARLVLNSVELGMYQYDVKLNSIPSGLERSLHFKVGLGNQQVQTFRFLSYSKVKTDYTCKIESPEFSVEKIVSAPPANNIGVEVSIDIAFEPSKLGDTRTQLIVSSPVGGDYICPLFGHCIYPKPQGPILIKQGSASSVSFKNVFSANAVFNCVVDNPAFIVKASETIPPKKTVALTIGYKAPGNIDKPNAATAQASAQPLMNKAPTVNGKTGKLTITNPAANVSWIFYLKLTT